MACVRVRLVRSQLALHEDVEPLPGDLRRHPEDATRPTPRPRPSGGRRSPRTRAGASSAASGSAIGASRAARATRGKSAAADGDPLRHDRARAVRQGRRPRRRLGGAAQGAARARAHGHHRRAALPRARSAGAAPRAPPHAAALHARRARLRGDGVRRAARVAGRPRRRRRARPLRPRGRLRRARRGLPGQRAALRASSRAPRPSSCASAPPAGRPFDVVHCNDWPTALVPDVPARPRGRDAGARRDAHRAHDPQRRAPGRLPEATRCPTLGLGWDAFTRRRHRVLRRHQPAQAGHPHGRRGHDREPHVRARDPDGRARRELDGVLRARGESLVGIINGVDYAVWNPATDPALAARYDAEDFANKARCKGALQQELGLPLDAGAPLVACVGRIVEQKGTDLVAAAIPKLLRATDAQVVVAGDGEPALVAAHRGGGREVARARRRSRARRARRSCTASSPGPTSCSCRAATSRAASCRCTRSATARCRSRARRAASSTRSSTATRSSRPAPGFLFDEPTRRRAARRDRARASRRARSPRWPALVRRVMRLDRGWERPARRYEQLYRVARRALTTRGSSRDRASRAASTARSARASHDARSATRATTTTWCSGRGRRAPTPPRPPEPPATRAADDDRRDAASARHAHDHHERAATGRRAARAPSSQRAQAARRRSGRPPRAPGSCTTPTARPSPRKSRTTTDALRAAARAPPRARRAPSPRRRCPRQSASADDERLERPRRPRAASEHGRKAQAARRWRCAAPRASASRVAYAIAISERRQRHEARRRAPMTSATIGAATTARTPCAFARERGRAAQRSPAPRAARPPPGRRP